MDIWNLTDLKPNERVLLAEIASFEANNRECFMSNEHAAKLLHVAESTARDYIDRLIHLGYVVREGGRYDRRLRRITQTNASNNANEVVKRRKRSSQTTQTNASNPAHTNTVTNTLTKSVTKSTHSRAEVVLPFQTQEFREAWTEWLEYKRTDHRFKYKTAQSEQRALMTLAHEHTTETEAIAAIHRAIANGYKGLVFDSSKSRRTGPSGKEALKTGKLRDELMELAKTGRITTNNRGRL
jgi:DNA-binding MarR family transcriptional regulator